MRVIVLERRSYKDYCIKQCELFGLLSFIGEE